MFRDVRTVTGTIHIDIESAPYDDLSFLECLEEAGSISVGLATRLSSTAGMPRLHALDRLRLGSAPEAGIMLEGLDGIVSLDSLDLSSTFSIKGFDMPYLERIGHIGIGSCYATIPEPVASAFTSLSGFEALRELDSLYLQANSSLQDLAIVDVLIENGAPPLGTAVLMFNHSLSTDLIEEKLGTIGVVNPGTICGNLGDDTPCSCPPSG
jgi:hypothetical protein